MPDLIIAPADARVNVTWSGQNGDLPDTVPFDSTDQDIRQWLTEAIRTGGVPGVAADPAADLSDFVVDRFPASEVRPYAMLCVRPKTPFGKVRRCACRFGPCDCPAGA